MQEFRYMVWACRRIGPFMISRRDRWILRSVNLRNLGLKFRSPSWISKCNHQETGVTVQLDIQQKEKQSKPNNMKWYFKLFRKYREVISGVTFWNVSDRSSWLDRRGGGKAYPLLFDTTYQPKESLLECGQF